MGNDDLIVVVDKPDYDEKVGITNTHKIVPRDPRDIDTLMRNMPALMELMQGDMAKMFPSRNHAVAALHMPAQDIGYNHRQSGLAKISLTIPSLVKFETIAQQKDPNVFAAAMAELSPKNSANVNTYAKQGQKATPSGMPGQYE